MILLDDLASRIEAAAAQDEWVRLTPAEAQGLLEAIRQLRDAWNVHMETCPQHAALPDLEPPSFEQIAEWSNAPTGSASAGGFS